MARRRRTSPFRFYQFWLNTDDRDVVNYLRYFTFLAETEIAALDEELARAPEKREAQRVARPRGHAHRCTARTRWSAPSAPPRCSSASASPSSTSTTSSRSSTTCRRPDVARARLRGERDGHRGDHGEGTALAASKGEATRLVKGGGVYVNNRRVADERARLTSDQAISGRVFVLRKGERQNHLLRIVDGAGAPRA